MKSKKNKSSSKVSKKKTATKKFVSTKGKKAAAKKHLAKKTSKPKVKLLKKEKAVKIPKLSKKAEAEAQHLGRLIERGKERGFVTYDEILKEFPTIEENIEFLESMYIELNNLGIDILEGGGLLEIPSEETDKKYSYNKSDSAYDSIQMYLKEIGQISTYFWKHGKGAGKTYRSRG
jgi:hypothetical protein